MTKPVSTTKKPHKQHTPEFHQEALKPAERIEVAAAAPELKLCESELQLAKQTAKPALFF